MIKGSLRKERVYFSLYFQGTVSPSLRETREELKRELNVGVRNIAYRLLSASCAASFLVQPRPTS